MQGLIQAIFDISVPILAPLIWAYPDLVLIKNKKILIKVIPAF